MSRANDLTKSVIGLLKLRGFMAWRNNSGMAKFGERFVSFGNVGSPDVMAIDRTGRFWAVEIKIGRDKMSPAQIAWHLDVEQRGGVSLVAKSIDDVINELDRRGIK